MRTYLEKGLKAKQMRCCNVWTLGFLPVGMFVMSSNLSSNAYRESVRAPYVNGLAEFRTICVI
jgi:hypothetical protein